MAKAKAEKCSECGGLPRGRGFAHAATCSQASRKGQAKGRATGDIVGMVNGRTSIATLLKLQDKVAEQLKERDGKDVAKVKAAMSNVEKLRKELAEAEALIG